MKTYFVCRAEDGTFFVSLQSGGDVVVTVDCSDDSYLDYAVAELCRLYPDTDATIADHTIPIT
ncbi:MULTISPECIES: hypothetical protein [Klebsiella/Raoultella group]|uniref:hypothetical protein n=1 Tax=Klebsiella/Raoultella group TaxID=2890311 RepID=UPI00115BC23B|nr:MULTISPECIES: hypothetical protein [Klebsiella/Raoultella group]HDZ9771247.1 hypothetical protein [Klebsiella variicola subsp. variicola]EKU0049784.1 hypothetical protein [Klebsiella quasipneumoniae]EKU3501493.1 hypothetical protein [Klebsiella quasipneumoniae]EKU3506637.1 hypothetical protein [Klebsiella quasipneumoniae]EKU3512174.1 hypothetical protein [Klebsiella quasipneumoniae]